MKKYLLLSLWLIGACSSSSDERILKSNVKNFMEEPHEIIATQFSNELGPYDIIVNNEKFETSYLLEDSIYYDYELVKRKLKESKKVYQSTEVTDTTTIKNIFIQHKLAYSGQKKLVIWE